MAQIQSNSLITASSVVNSFLTEVVSVNPSGSGANLARGNTVNLADGIRWGASVPGGLGAQWPTNDLDPLGRNLWANAFSANTLSFPINRSGGTNIGSNAWSTANIQSVQFNSAALGTPQDPVYASKYSGNGVPNSTALLYESANNFLSINWTIATRYLLGGSPTVYGPSKGTFNTGQFVNNFANPIGPLGYDNPANTGSVADATYGAGNTVANPSANSSNQTEWGINNYFQALKTAFNSRPMSTVSITVCHSSCHSSCHGSRGRR